MDKLIGLDICVFCINKFLMNSFLSLRIMMCIANPVQEYFISYNSIIPLLLILPTASIAEIMLEVELLIAGLCVGWNDYDDTDLKFARNCGMRFFEPEEVFCNI